MATKAKAGISRRESLKAGGKAAYVAANRQRTDAKMRIKRRNTSVRLASREA